MIRHKKTVEKMLSHEREIREAVEAERGSFSFLTACKYDEIGGRGGIADKTAQRAIYLADELEAVTVKGIGTVKRPESWIAVFDAVRWLAMLCERPDLILSEWAARFLHGRRHIEESFTAAEEEIISLWAKIVEWIFENVERLAVQAGLICAAA